MIHWLVTRLGLRASRGRRVPGDWARVTGSSVAMTPGSVSATAVVSPTADGGHEEGPTWPGHLLVLPAEQPGRLDGASGHLAWGWLAPLCLTMAIGLLLIGVADFGARTAAAWSNLLFWLGLVVVYAPVTVRLAMPGGTDRERLSLAVVLGGALYCVKVMHSPTGFTFHDEFLHWRTAQDLLTTGHLFEPNPLLPASVFYPGLEAVTVALVNTSGLSIFMAGMIIVGIARLVLVVALYLFFEQLSHSRRVAGLASALYMTHPNFVYFDAQFSYESLALPLAAIALWLISSQLKANGRTGLSRLGLSSAAVVVLVALAATHHLSSYLLAGFLGLWTLAAVSYRLRGPLAWLLGLPADWMTRFSARWLHHGWGRTPAPARFAVLAIALNVLWLLAVAAPTMEYLGPVAGGAGRGVLSIITGAGEQQLARQLFQTAGGQVIPLWQRGTAIGSVLLILAALPLGLIVLWRRYRISSLALALACATLIYPAGLVMRLTGSAWEVANRSSAFSFVGLSFVLALACIHLVRSRHRWAPPLSRLAVGVAPSILLIGGMVSGWPPAWHLPGPYLPGADTRSIEPQGLAAASWARVYLGPGNRVAADRINHLLMGSYGDQWAVSTLNGGVDSSWVFLADELGDEEQEILLRGQLRYMVVDRRLNQQPVLIEAYPGTDPRQQRYRLVPIEPAILDKFDQAPWLSRIFDSGDIIIYRVELEVLAGDT